MDKKKILKKKAEILVLKSLLSGKIKGWPLSQPVSIPLKLRHNKSNYG